MLFAYTDYRSYLKAVLAEKISKNPTYSLRALARDFGIAAPTLSEVLNRKKHISQELAHQIGGILGLNSVEMEYLSLLVQYQKTRKLEVKETLYSRLQAMHGSKKQQVHDLSIEAFKVIADWYHFPILEMIRLDDFDFTPKSIAKRLGISSHEAAAAIERLIRLELLSKDKNGRYRKEKTHMVVNSDSPNSALRRFHRQMLSKAIESLDTQSPQEKVVGSETFSFDSKMLPEAKKIIEEFFSKMVACKSKHPHPTDIYHLGVQFFNLTKQKGEKV